MLIEFQTGFGNMSITKLGNFNQVQLNNLINLFEASHSRTANLAARMRLWRPGGDLDSHDKLDLVSYCNPMIDTREPARDFARQISKLVFGKIISRLD